MNQVDSFFEVKRRFSFTSVEKIKEIFPDPEENTDLMETEINFMGKLNEQESKMNG